MLTKIAEAVLKRDPVIVIAGLVAVTALAWMYMLHFASSMTSLEVSRNGGMDINTMEMSMPRTLAWRSEDIVLNFIMWVVMMVAMMTPSVTPMILMVARVNRQRDADQTPIPTTIAFLLGYWMVWSSFSAGATLAQWGLHSAAILSTEMMRVTPLFGGILLILAGMYQFTRLKRVCLSHCRTPLTFLMTEWREGTRGALIMGVRHGSYCVGCCWLLMTLLFADGLMNLLWVALLAGCVLIEKVTSTGQWVSHAIGLLEIGWGAWLLTRTLAM